MRSIPGVLALEVGVVDAAEYQLTSTVASDIPVQPEAEDGVLQELLLDSIVHRWQGASNGNVWESQTLHVSWIVSPCHKDLNKGIQEAC